MFQEFGANALAVQSPLAERERRREEASDLIRRYPNLSETELARLINLYRDFSALDMAMVISNEELAPNLDLFSADHRSKVRTPFRQYAALVIYAVLTIVALGWAAAVAS
jgi:hypothetical protein